MPGTVDESVLDFVELVFEMVRAVDGERTEPEVEGNTALCFGKKIKSFNLHYKKTFTNSCTY